MGLKHSKIYHKCLVKIMVSSYSSCEKCEFVIRVVGNFKSTMFQFFLSRFLIMKTYTALNSSKFILNHVNIFQLLRVWIPFIYSFIYLLSQCILSKTFCRELFKTLKREFLISGHSVILKSSPETNFLRICGKTKISVN